ncbi:MAG: hypothetical protein GX308_09250 [Epulopiscium sp.]|nr:hypothetical protein [Candidatus Epulonipiscium sp.]
MIQAQEEREYAILFIQYMQNNNLKVIFESIDKPDKKYDSCKAPVLESLEHEQYITSSINDIYTN